MNESKETTNGPSYDSVRHSTVEMQLAAQKETENQRTKYESRRTALQIAERTCRNLEGSKGNSAEVLQDAELIYQWLINGLIDDK